MKKLGIVLGVAAVATITGCKDPDYVGHGSRDSQNEVKRVETGETKPVRATAKTEPDQESAKGEKPTTTVAVVEASCMCPPGTKHVQPCSCGATDCRCIVEKPQPTPPPEPEYTIYVVQSGDYLAKISKKYNITIAAIREINPSVKNSDLIRVGQKLKLPGKIAVSAQPVPAKTEKAMSSKPSAFKPYAGATKEYVVKSGDTLGGIAYGNGINIRQLKELNGLSGDIVRVGQKLKVPADGKVVQALSKPQVSKSAAKDAGTKTLKPTESKTAGSAETKAEPVADGVKTDVAEDATVQPTASESEKTATPKTTTYVVQEGDDMTGVSIAFGVTAAAIRELNNLGDNEQLKPGQVIKLPAEDQQ